MKSYPKKRRKYRKINNGPKNSERAILYIDYLILKSKTNDIK